MAQANVFSTESIDDIYGGFEIGNLDALTEDVKALEDEDLMNAFMAGTSVGFTGFEEFRQWWDSFTWAVTLEKSSVTHLKFKILTGEESDEEGKGWFWVDMFVEDVPTFLDRLEELEEELDNYPVDFIAEYLKDNNGAIFTDDLDVVALEGETREEEIENFGRYILDQGYMPELEEALDSPYVEINYYSLGDDCLQDYDETKSYAYRVA